MTPRTQDELADRIFEACNATWDVLTIHIGRKLGFYAALAASGPMTSPELAAATAADERYVREWLEQQTVTGILDVDTPNLPSGHRRFSLDPAYAEVLLDEDSLAYLGPAASMTAAAAATLPSVMGAFANGGGVGWDVFGEDMRRGQGDINRPLLLHVLGPEWLASLSDVDTALRVPGARAAEIGAGVGWGAIGVARTYPEVTVVGYDIDPPSVVAAAANAADLGVADRTEFRAVDPAQDPSAEAYDLVFAVECIHDMADPVPVLAAMRAMVKDGGTVLVIDERTADVFDPQAGDMERFFYGFSITTCLPDGLSHAPSVGTGTVMRRSTLESFATEAGFTTVTVAPIDHEQFRVYQLS